MIRLRHALVLVFLCLMTYTFPGSALAVDGGVWIALGEPGGAYAEAAEAARTELMRGSGRGEPLVRPWRELVAAGAAPPRLVVAVGVGAMRGIADSGLKVPMVATLVPRASYQRFVESVGGGRNVTAVWLDQPVVRQMELLRLALPQRRRVGVLFGADSRLFEQELLRAGSERGLDIVAAHAYSGEQVPTSLQRTLEDADVLLALPDPQIYNSSTIQNILTAAYRRRLPLVGFSAAYVKAGALLALYSTPAQVGTQAGEIARATLAGKPLPPPQWPREFAVGVNADVSRSLGVPLDGDSGARLTDYLRTRERAP